MGTKMKTAVQVRNEAADIARWAAQDRELTGDPEGAEVIRQIVKDIMTIRIRSTQP